MTKIIAWSGGLVITIPPDRGAPCIVHHSGWQWARTTTRAQMARLIRGMRNAGFSKPEIRVTR